MLDIDDMLTIGGVTCGALLVIGEVMFFMFGALWFIKSLFFM